MTERYVLASKVQDLRNILGSGDVVVTDSYTDGCIDTRADVCRKLSALLASAVELPESGRRWRVVCQSCGASEEGSENEVPLRLHGRMEDGHWQHYVANAFTAHEWCGPVVFENGAARPVPDDKLGEAVETLDRYECYAFESLHNNPQPESDMRKSTGGEYVRLEDVYAIMMGGKP